MTTIKDVARHVGLSVTTVSRALNDFDDVSEATRARVRAAAETLDYHPNAVARRLQRRHSSTIGLMIPLVLHRSFDIFWLEFIGGVAAACSQRGVDLLVATADAHDDVGQGLHGLTRGSRVDGLLVCDIRQSDPRIAYLQRHRFPFVAFGRTTERQDYPYIDVDGAAGVMQAMAHLIGLGHRRIAYLGLDPAFGFSHYRFTGYMQALRNAGLTYDAGLSRVGLGELSAPAAVAEVLGLPDPPTAVIAAADFLAQAVLKAARALGLAVPGDLSIVVFDDSPLVQHAEPPLTAIHQPNTRLGEEAAGLLLDRVAGPDSPLVQRLVVPSLIVRDSTAPPREPPAHSSVY